MQSFIRIVLTFLVSMVFGSVSFEIADYINRSSYVLDIRRVLLIGTIFGIAWIPASYIARKSIVLVAVVGCLTPLIVPVATVIGLWLVFFVIAFFYVFLPIGFFNGLIVYAVWYGAKRITKESEREANDLANSRQQYLQSDNPYQPPVH